MRVLHVHSGNLYGGVETLLFSLAKFGGFAPVIMMSAALTHEGKIAAQLREYGIPVTILGHARLSRPFSVRRARRALAALLERDRPDVVVCHQPWPVALFGQVVRQHSIPLVLWLHMAASRHVVDRLAWRVQLDAVVCNSRFTASTIAMRERRAPVHVVYAPVACETVKRDTQRTVDQVVIIQVSRMERWKGQAVCLEALGRLRRVPRWVCWQVGGAQRQEEARYLTSLRAAADRLDIADRVKFLGQRSDVAELLAAADIYCQPNIEPEPFGISLIEALAAGLPVVTSAAGGALEIVDENCGALVPAGDVAALADALESLVSDPGRRRRLGATGPARAKQLCDPAVQMPRIGEILHRVADSTVHQRA